MPLNVAILGASANPDRFSYKTLKTLAAQGYRALPVNPFLKEIDGAPVYPSLSALPVAPHSITVYLSAPKSNPLLQEILDCGATRVIFNPGAENPALMGELKSRGIEVVEACTLVMLATASF